MLPIGVIGASGIGAIHVRELLRAGATVSGVLCSTPESSEAAAKRLGERFGVSLRGFPDLKTLLESPVRAIVIATPAETHLDLLRESLLAGKFVLCEKPLFWLPRGDLSELVLALDELEPLAPGRLTINTCNLQLFDRARQLCDLPERPRSFRFEFFTRGPHRGREIGVDLLPHALSFLQRLAPDAHPQEVRILAREREFESTLRWGEIECAFHFRQDPGGEKRLAFALDDVTVVRQAEIVDGSYRIRLQRGDDPGASIEIEDPFAVAAADFVRGVERRLPFAQDFAFAARNQWLLGQILCA